MLSSCVCVRLPDLRQELAVVKRSESQPLIKGVGLGDLPSPPSLPSLQMPKSLSDGCDKQMRSIIPSSIPEGGVDSNRLAEEQEGGLHMVATPSLGTSPTTPVTTKGASRSVDQLARKLRFM